MATKRQLKKRKAKSVGAEAAQTDAAEGTAEATAAEDAPVNAKAEKASDFIRRHLDAGKSAGEIVELAKAAGLEFSRGLIYALKSRASKGGPKRGPGRPPGSASVAKTPRAVRRGAGAQAPTTNQDAQFRRAALELGIARARTLLDDLERAIAQIIG